jgi:hypothetical protein
MVLVGSSVCDVVRTAGGCIFDRVSAGWDVLVLVADHPDTRALEILGARVLDLDTAYANVSEPFPQALAVCSDLIASDERVRREILDVLGGGYEKEGVGMDVTVWGESCPDELKDRFAPDEHRLSMAARVFKAQALAAAGCAVDTVAPTEAFRVDLLRPPGRSLLVSAS